MDWIPFLYNIIRAVFVMLDIALLGVLILSIIKGWEFRPKLMQDMEPKEKIFTLEDAIYKERWAGILEKAGGAPESAKLAVIEADTLADELLKGMQLEGETMADRLDQLADGTFSTIERLWRAHKIRNQLVHEPDFKISREEATRALEDYEAFLKEAGAI